MFWVVLTILSNMMMDQAVIRYGIFMKLSSKFSWIVK